MSSAIYQDNLLHSSYHSMNNDFMMPSVSTYEAAYTTTSAIFSMSLTVFTLSALYQGIQNIPITSTKQYAL